MSLRVLEAGAVAVIIVGVLIARAHLLVCLGIEYGWQNDRREIVGSIVFVVRNSTQLVRAARDVPSPIVRLAGRIAIRRRRLYHSGEVIVAVARYVIVGVLECKQVTRQVIGLFSAALDSVIDEVAG